MPWSGSTTVKVTDYDSLRFTWQVNNQYADTGRSSMTYKLELISGSYGRIDSSVAKTARVKLTNRGSSVLIPESVYTVYVDIGNNETKELCNGLNTIQHTAAGEATVDYTFSVDFDITFSGKQIGTISGSGTAVFPTIPRISTLSGANGTLGTAQTLTITRQDSDFRHKISYKCGSASGYVLGSDTAVANGTSISWTPPLTLASQNTTGTTVSVDFVLGTYYKNALVGYDYLTLKYTIPASVKPSVSCVLEDVTGLDGTYGSPVRALSRIKIKATPTTAYGSPIKSCVISANGDKYTGTEATTGVLKTAGDSPVTVTVTDARGRTGSWSYTMKVKEYNRPSVTALDVHRCDADGTNNDQGEYIRVTFSAAVTNIAANSANAASYKLGYKKSSATSYTTVTLSALAGKYTVTDYEYIFKADSGSSYDVEITATDSFSTSARSTSASTAFVLMHWGADGTSLGVGKVAEAPNTMDVALDMHVTGDREQTGNRWALSSPGVAGSEGYILMARIEVTAANADTPITFVFSQRRQETPMTVHVQLRNSTADTSALQSIRYEGTNYGAFLVQSGELVWDLYVQKVSTYDTITLQDWWTSKTMCSRVALTFPGTLVSALPGDYYRATPPKLDSLRDYIYPVGSVYISYSHVSPADLFGGTWVRIENAFLWGVDSDGTIGQTGGEKTHTLTVSELPAHSHGSVYSQHATGIKDKAWYNTSGSSVAYGAVSTGGGAAHNNMPPYVQVSIWRRTA